jgi:spore coat polysaccharide biosynthesis protein SpsF
MEYKTEQEAFWAGNFGSHYIERNNGSQLLAANLAFFAKALARADAPTSCIEFGANIGMNLQALSLIFPQQELSAVEINSDAVAELHKLLPEERVHHSSILNFDLQRQWDLAIIKGVLIHINPEHLATVYDKLYAACRRYLLVSEYYNPTPVAVPYRGYSDRLFKRDFAGEIMDRYTDLKLLDYGFVYQRDNNFAQDDITWFLMEKKA